MSLFLHMFHVEPVLGLIPFHVEPFLHTAPFHVEPFPMFHAFHVEPFRSLALTAAQASVSVLWQSALLVAATWLILRLIPRLGAAARFLVWTSVFAVSAALPFLHLIGKAGVAASATPQFQLDERWSYALAGMWIAASLFRLAGLIVQAARLRSLWKSALPVPRGTDTAELAAVLANRPNLASRSVELCTSSEVDRPSVIGFLAPRILVPAWLYNEMTPVELRHVVLHEMEHLRRRDDWINLLQKIALVLFPLNPALIWLDRRLAAERELACDDGVLAATHMPRAYATSLASIAERRLQRKLHRRVFALALGALGAEGILRNKPEFSRRIEGILNRRGAASPALAAAVSTMLVLAVAAGGATLARSPELVSFAPAASANVASEPASSNRLDIVDTGAMQRFSGSNMVPAARSQNAVFHQSAAPRRVKPFAPTRPAAAAGDLVQRVSAVRPATNPQWFVLTSANQDAPARVVVRTADGRFFVAPYAAVPVALGTQDGWLILQL
jgi:beta-lactamase regulating signal transducer with metallopeptidase domain